MRAAALGLVLALLPSASPAQERTSTMPCAPVTIVTYPWAEVRSHRGPASNAPATLLLCGRNALSVTWPGYEPLVDTLVITDTVPVAVAYSLERIGDEPLEPVVLTNDSTIAQAVALYFRHGDAREALRRLQNRLASGRLHHADSVTALMFSAFAARALGDTTAARQAVEAALELEPCLMPADEYLPPAWRRDFTSRRGNRCNWSTLRFAATSALSPGRAHQLIGQDEQARKHRRLTVSSGIAAASLFVLAEITYRGYRSTNDPLAVVEVYDRAVWLRRAGGVVLLGAIGLYGWNLLEAWDAATAHSLRVAPWIGYRGASGAAGASVRLEF